MLWKTHLAFGFLTGLLILPFVVVSNVYIWFSIVLLASLFPDIDHSKSKISSKVPIIPKFLQMIVKHRGIIHSLPFLAIVVIGVNYFFDRELAIATLVGYVSHLIADGLTLSGINFLHPFGQLKLQGFIQTGSVTELVVFIGLLVVIGFKLFI